MIWGILMDILPFKTIMLINVGVQILFCGTIAWSVQNQATYLITVVIVYGFYGGLYSIFPTQTIRMLGKKIGSKMYYITFVGFSAGVLLQYLAHKILV
jgi:hypothetical protein